MKQIPLGLDDVNVSSNVNLTSKLVLRLNYTCAYFVQKCCAYLPENDYLVSFISVFFCEVHNQFHLLSVLLSSV